MSGTTLETEAIISLVLLIKTFHHESVDGYNELMKRVNKVLCTEYVHIFRYQA